MSFKEIESDIELSYDSIDSDIIKDFFNKVLSESVRYDQISGFFNPLNLALAARGVDKLVKNNGHMRLLCSAQLDEEDLESINNGDDLKQIIDQKFLRDYSSIEDDLIKNYIKILGWMLSYGYLEIKIVCHKASDGSYASGMLHSRFGILYDDFEDSLVFVGANSSIFYGVSNNIESLDVYSSLEDLNMVKKLKERFDTFWNDLNPYYCVFDIPKLSKNKLNEIAPKSKEELENILK